MQLSVISMYAGKENMYDLKKKMKAMSMTLMVGTRENEEENGGPKTVMSCTRSRYENNAPGKILCLFDELFSLYQSIMFS